MGPKQVHHNPKNGNPAIPYATGIAGRCDPWGGGLQPPHFNLLKNRTKKVALVSAFCSVRWQYDRWNPWIATRGPHGADSAFFFLCRCSTLARGV